MTNFTQWRLQMKNLFATALVMTFFLASGALAQNTDSGGSGVNHYCCTSGTCPCKENIAAPPSGGNTEASSNTTNGTAPMGIGSPKCCIGGIRTCCGVRSAAIIDSENSGETGRSKPCCLYGKGTCCSTGPTDPNPRTVSGSGNSPKPAYGNVFKVPFDCATEIEVRRTGDTTRGSGDPLKGLNVTKSKGAHGSAPCP